MAIAFTSGSAMAGWVSVPTIGGQEVIVQDKNANDLAAAVSADFELSGAESLAAGDIIAVRVTAGVWADVTAGGILTATVPAVPGALSVASTTNGVGIPTGPDVVFFEVIAPIISFDIIEFNVDDAATGHVNLNGVTLGEGVFYTISFHIGGGPNAGNIKHSVDNISTGLVAEGINLLNCSLPPLAPANARDTISAATQYSTFTSPLSTAGTVVGDNVGWSIRTNNVSGANTTNANIPVEDLILNATGAPAAEMVIETLPTLAAFAGSAANGTTAGGGAGDFFFDTVNNTPEHYQSNTVVLDGVNTLTLNPFVTLNSPPTVNTPSFAVVYSASVSDSSSWEAQTLTACNPTYVATRDGVSFSSNNLGMANIVKVTDTSGAIAAAGATTTLIGFQEDGTMMTSSLTPDPLPSNGTIRLTGPDILNSFSSTPFRVDFIVETDALEASNVKTTDGGGGLLLRSTTIYRSEQYDDTVTIGPFTLDLPRAGQI